MRRNRGVVRSLMPVSLCTQVGTDTEMGSPDATPARGNHLPANGLHQPDAGQKQGLAPAASSRSGGGILAPVLWGAHLAASFTLDWGSSSREAKKPPEAASSPAVQKRDAGTHGGLQQGAQRAAAVSQKPQEAASKQARGAALVKSDWGAAASRQGSATLLSRPSSSNVSTHTGARHFHMLQLWLRENRDNDAASPVSACTLADAHAVLTPYVQSIQLVDPNSSSSMQARLMLRIAFCL